MNMCSYDRETVLGDIDQEVSNRFNPRYRTADLCDEL